MPDDDRWDKQTPIPPVPTVFDPDQDPVLYKPDGTPLVRPQEVGFRPKKRRF